MVSRDPPVNRGRSATGGRYRGDVSTRLTKRLTGEEAKARDGRLRAVGLTRRREKTSVITLLRKTRTTTEDGGAVA